MGFPVSTILREKKGAQGSRNSTGLTLRAVERHTARLHGQMIQTGRACTGRVLGFSFVGAAFPAHLDSNDRFPYHLRERNTQASLLPNRGFAKRQTMDATQKLDDEPAVPRRRRRRTSLRFAAPVVFVLLLVYGGWWFYRELQFTRLRLPLIEAVTNQDVARVRSLLDRGADPDVRTDYVPETESFTWAGLLRMLRGRKTSPPSQGPTVLMMAAQSHRSDILRLLLEHGANVHLKAEPGDERSALAFAAQEGDYTNVKALVDRGADIHAADAQGHTPLYHALYGDTTGWVWQSPETGPGETRCSQFLLQHGAQANVHADDGQTPLQYATLWSLRPALHLLLEHGVDVDAQDENGRTALMIAVDNQEPGAVEILIQAGAKIDLRNKIGETALRIAVEGREVNAASYKDPPTREYSLEVARQLLEAGADVQSKAKDGKTVLQAAKALGNPPILALLQKAAVKRR